MKLKSRKSFAAVLTTALLFTACSKDKLNEVDFNPTVPTDVSVDLLLPQVEVASAFAVTGADLAWYSSVFVEQTAGRYGQLRDYDRRINITSTLANNSWTDIYANLGDLKQIIQKGSDGGDEAGAWMHVGIAKVLTAYNYSVATDLFGRVPFSQALMGTENLAPAFDAQRSIYQGIIAMLDDAVADLQKTTTRVPTSDLIHGGDADAWIATAYSLKARFLMRLSNTPDYNAAAVQDALDKSWLAMGSAGDGAYFQGFTDNATGENPWYQEYNDRAYLAPSEHLYNYMDARNDPRIPITLTQVDGAYAPAPNGQAIQDQAGTIYSFISDHYINATHPIPLVTYEEMAFIQAELDFRNGGSAAATSSYQDAIIASLEREGISSSDASDYALNVLVTPVEGPTLEDIITQKWLSFFPFGSIEAYNDFRRTGFPATTNPRGPAPRRLPYPQSELDANSGNVPSTPFTNGVWWDDLSDD